MSRLLRKRTIAYIYMSLSNKYVRYCHTNIGNCSFNGAFLFIYICYPNGSSLAGQNIKTLVCWWSGNFVFLAGQNIKTFVYWYVGRNFVFWWWWDGDCWFVWCCYLSWTYLIGKIWKLLFVSGCWGFCILGWFLVGMWIL